MTAEDKLVEEKIDRVCTDLARVQQRVRDAVVMMHAIAEEMAQILSQMAALTQLLEERLTQIRRDLVPRLTDGGGAGGGDPAP